MNLQTGDMIQRPGPLRTDHVGIYLGRDAWGRQWVIHNAKSGFVHEDLLEMFAAGLPVALKSRVARNSYEQRLIVERARSLLGQKYDLLNFNCDHFATFAQTGVAFSPQLRAFAGFVGMAFVVGLAMAVSKA